MSSEVRLAVQRALDKLITRFGNPSEVIGELQAALRVLDREEVPASSTHGTEAVVSLPEPEATTSGPAADEPEADPPPANARFKRGYGGKRK